MARLAPVLLLSLLLAPLTAQDQKVLSVEDYGAWQRISNAALSPDGRWMSYSLVPNEGDGVLYVKELDGETVHEAGVASRVAFSEDSRWVAYLLSPGEEESKKLRKAKKPVQRSLELRDLGGGEPVPMETVQMEKVQGFAFSEDSAWLAVQRVRADSKAEHRGSDLILRELATGLSRNLGNVSSYAFNEAGDLLAFTVDADGMVGNGLYLLDLQSGVQKTLDQHEARYAQMRWNEAGSRVLVLRGDVPEGHERRANSLVIASALDRRDPEVSIYDPAEDRAVPEGMILSELRAPEFLRGDGVIALGLKDQKAKPEKDEDEERANVDVWHWRDAPIQSVQQRRAGRNRNATLLAALHLDGMRLVLLTEDERERVQIVGEGRWAIARDDASYRHELNWGGGRADTYRVDLADGSRSKITDGLRRAMGTSPDGRYYLFLKGGKVWVEDLDGGDCVDLSGAAGVDFVNHGDDHPYEKPAYGVAGWTADKAAVVLNHEFDLWLCPLDGSSAKNLTGGLGEKDQIRFRYQRLDPEEEWIDLSAPVMLSAYGEWTKKSGFFELGPAQDAPQPLLWEDASFGRPVLAPEAKPARIALTRQTFVDSPDWHVADGRFQDLRQVTESNPQQDEYAWGRRVLVDYENSRGLRMQATLTLPAGYKAGERYPMLVYFYEKMSQRHHQYSMPRFDDRPHMSTYASDGYLVLMPDIVYEPGRPGDSAVDCIGSAVRAVIDGGYADPDRIGLQGHSWGGYQSSFVLTQTDMFCCVVTGAPVTNLVSFHGELYKSSGSSQQGIVEIGQVRMGTDPWSNIELFHSQSPVHNVRGITTPFLILHGTEDGAVDWHQGLEYYNAARRNGKQVILLSYPGEAHHLNNKANAIDFQIRMKQWFDHYCKGTEAPSWMVEGVPFLEKDAADLRSMPSTRR